MVSDERTEEMAELFKLLGEPNRLRLVRHCVSGERTVGSLAEELQLSPSLISHHLRLLRAGRVLAARREGRHVLYGLADSHIERIVVDMADHVAEDHDAH